LSNFDKKAKDDFKARTDKDAQGLKDEIWNALEKELFTENQTPRGDVRKMKKKNRVMPIILTVAAGVLIAFSLQTDTGTAFMKSIKEMFVPEKDVIQSIEGHDEKTNVQLNEGKDSDYVLYVDETRYKMVQGDDSDLITPKDPLPEKYPDVSMEIKQVPDVKPEVLVKEYEAALKKEFPELRAIEEVTEPVDGFLLHGINGNQADSVVVHAYVISNGKEGSFVITEHYFLEAAEGHGARFHRMLETFEIVE
jgi:predicted small secreted protein